MKKYIAIVHYNGSYNYYIDAESEEEAKEIAENMFCDADPLEVWNNIDWEVCDCWEDGNGK